MATPKTESIMNFNQVIGSPGTFETGMYITIFEAKLTNFFWQMQLNTISKKKEQYYYHPSVRKFTKYFLIYVFLALLMMLEYDTLMKSLNKYFKSIKLYVAARYTFYQAKQIQDKLVCQYTRVKNLVSK